MDNREEMNRFLEKVNLQRLNQEEKETLNNPITNTEIKNYDKQSHKKTKAQGWMALQGNYIKHLQKS